MDGNHDETTETTFHYESTNGTDETSCYDSNSLSSQPFPRQEGLMRGLDHLGTNALR